MTRTITFFTMLLSILAAVTLTCTNAIADTTPQQLVGDWNGALAINNAGQLPLVFHFTDTNGNPAATLDSPAQNSYGLKGGTLSVSGNTVTSTFPIVHGIFTGTVSADANTITGTWSQGSSIALVLTRQVPVRLPPSLIGKWIGLLVTPRASLHLVLTFATQSGAATATLQSPDQGKGSYLSSNIRVNNRTITVLFSSIGGSLVVTPSADNKTLTGKWNQGGVSLPLSLTMQP